MTDRRERFWLTSSSGLTITHPEEETEKINLPPRITLIAARAANGVIGSCSDIPWHIPEDFKHFSSTTKGHCVIMGSRTWDSLPDKFRPLPNRVNIVLSRHRTDEEGAHWFSSIRESFRFGYEESVKLGVDDIFVIGGAEIYALTIDMADRLLISQLPDAYAGDSFFPVIGPEWTVSERDEREKFTILNYRRKD